MRRPPAYVLVLWGPDFEEMTATLLITLLRHSGLVVKVVGLNMQRLTGAHGVALVPDITLEQALALAHQAICVIVPCPWRQFQQFSYDPRLAELLELAQTNDARFVIGQKGRMLSENSSVLETLLDGALEIPAQDELLDFAHELAKTLLSWGAPQK